jgi:hypothetical protein
MGSYTGMSLGAIAELNGAKICEQFKSLIVAKTKEANGGMYFSGQVIWHLSVLVDGGGVNGAGQWPFYLSDDNGNLKIIPA